MSFKQDFETGLLSSAENTFSEYPGLSVVVIMDWSVPMLQDGAYNACMCHWPSHPDNDPATWTQVEQSGVLDEIETFMNTYDINILRWELSHIYGRHGDKTKPLKILIRHTIESSTEGNSSSEEGPILSVEIERI
jgi:hypothetical protein